jgi:hypothetical protein
VLKYVELEIEAAFRSAERVTLTWIGHAGRHGAEDVLPTITGEALEALREDGPRKTVASEELTWLKVCVDPAGKVEAAHPRFTTSPEALEAAVATAMAWRFRPFVLDGAPIAACAMVALAHPTGDDVEPAVLPLALPDSLPDAIGMSAQAVSEYRVAGKRSPASRSASIGAARWRP